jgi:hypothetical protein
MRSCFVMMPFGQQRDRIYRELIVPACLRQQIKCKRADSMRVPKNILNDIIDGILTADMLIADLSDNNPNVFYELGIAHAAARNVILIADQTTMKARLPFDISTYRVLQYTYSTKGKKKFLRELTSTIRDMALDAGLSTPYSDAIHSSRVSSHHPGMSTDSPRVAWEKVYVELLEIWSNDDRHIVTRILQKTEKQCDSRTKLFRLLRSEQQAIESSHSDAGEAFPRDLTICAVDDHGRFVFHPSKANEPIEIGHAFHGLIGTSKDLFWINRYSSERFDLLKAVVPRRNLRITRAVSRFLPALGITVIVESHINLLRTLPRPNKGRGA